MTRRSVWVVESRHETSANAWRTEKMFKLRKDARASRYGMSKLVPHREWRVVEYTPKGGEEESDG